MTEQEATTLTPRWEVVVDLGGCNQIAHVIRGACRDSVLAKARRVYSRLPASRFTATPLRKAMAERDQDPETMQQRAERIRGEVYESIGNEEITGTEIATINGLHRSTVANHLKVLARKGLIEYVQRGSGSKPMSVRRVA